MADRLIGKEIVVLGANYIYTGVLEDVTPDKITLRDPSIVYETGAWTDKKWKDAQRLPTDLIDIERTAKR